MTVRQSVPLNIRLNNPGALRAYIDTDYNDGYERGLAKYRTARDGWNALTVHIRDVYSLHRKHTWRDFVCQWCDFKEHDPLQYGKVLMHLMKREDEDWMLDDIRARSTLEILSLAMAISIVENGRPPTHWPTGKWWVSLPDLIKFSLGEGK